MSVITTKEIATAAVQPAPVYKSKYGSNFRIKESAQATSTITPTQLYKANH